MAFNGNEGSLISRAEARELMDNYEDSAAFPANNHTKGMLFGKNRIEALLAQPGCTGLRIYYGKTGTANTDEAKMIIVGTDSEGNDMTNLILDAGLPCPSYCPSEGSRL